MKDNLYFLHIFFKLRISTNTYEQLQFSMKICENLRLKKADVIFHIIL